MTTSETPPARSPGSLDARERARLRGLGNPLQPVIQIGKEGLTPALQAQLARNLDDHELVKVKILKTAETDRFELAEQLAVATGSHVVQVIGRTVLLYRRNTRKPRLDLNASGEGD